MTNPKLLLALYILVLPLFIVTVIFNVLNNVPGTGVFLRTTGETSNLYSTEITPSSYTFFIWFVIYILQLVWIIYALTFLCRQGPDGPLYLNPVLLTSLFFGIYILSLGLNVFWLFMFDRELMELAFVLIAGLAATLWATLALSYIALFENRFVLADQNRKYEDTLIRVFVHNGIAMYAAWVTVATFVNMAIVIAYRSKPLLDQGTAAVVSLSFLSVVLVLYYTLDFTIFDEYARYTFTPYLVFTWALVGIFVNNYVPLRASSIFTAVLLSISILALIVKIVLAIVWSFRKPLFTIGAK